MDIDNQDETVEISIVKLAVMCDALHIVQKYMNVEHLKQDLDKCMEDEDSFYATVFTMALFMAKEELNHLFKGKEKLLKKIRGKDYIVSLVTHYSKLMGEDLKTRKGWNTEELNNKAAELSNTTNEKNKIEMLERMLRAESYEKN